MSILFGILGAVAGAIIGLMGAFLFASETDGGNSLAGGFTMLAAAPVGLLVGIPSGIVLALRVLRFLRVDDPDRALRRRKGLLMAGLVVGIPGFIGVMNWAAWRTHEPPLDQELLRNFRSHRTTFDQLIQMEQKDRKLTRVDGDWTDPADPQTIGVSPARITEYRRLLRSAEVPRGFQATDDAIEVDFYYWLAGSAITSDTDKGYAYLAKPPAHLLTSLDQCRPDEKNGVKAYRHIQGNWYLFYDYLPG